MDGLLSFRQYAARIHVAPSSISRAVAKGRVPTVEIDGKRLINPHAADAARAARNVSAGGSPETRAAMAARWRAKLNQGFDLGQLRMLGVLTAHGPRLLAEGMKQMGGINEIEIARASAVLNELIGYLACSTFDDFNQSGVTDYRKVLPPVIEPDLQSDEARDFFRRLANPDAFDDIDLDAEIWPMAWTDSNGPVETAFSMTA